MRMRSSHSLMPRGRSLCLVAAGLTPGQCASRAAPLTGSKRGADHRCPSPSVMCVSGCTFQCVLFRTSVHVVSLHIAHYISPTISSVCLLSTPPGAPATSHRLRSPSTQWVCLGCLKRLSLRSWEVRSRRGETAIATGPGMYGRMWLCQSLAFYEAYQIRQEHMRLPDASIHPSLYLAHMSSVLYDRTQRLCCIS